MAPKFGGHVLIGGVEWNQFKRDVLALNPRTLTLTGASLQQCDEIFSLLGGRCRVSIRYWPFDGEDYLKHDPLSWLSEQSGRGYLHIARCLINEPAANDPRFIQWLEALLTYANGLGDKCPPLTVGLFAVGTPGDGVIEFGAYDTVLRLLAESKGRHQLSCHVYLAGNVYCDGAAGLLDDPIAYDISRWDWDTMADWHVKRHERFIRRAETLGIGPINIVFNEFGYDTLPDTQQHPDMQALAGQYNGGQALRGFWSGYDRLYPDLAGMDAQTYTIKQCEWLFAHLHPWVKSVEPFVLADFDTPGSNVYWATLYGITARKTPALWDWMCQHNQEGKPMNLKPVYVEASGEYVNERELPTTQSAIIDALPKGRKLALLQNVDFSKTADGWTWGEFYYEEESIYKPSYFALEYITITPRLPAPEPTPAPTPDPASDYVMVTMKIPRAQYELLRSVFVMLGSSAAGWENLE